VKEKVGDMGYRESYLGVKYPSARPSSSIGLIVEVEGWHLQGSKHQEKKLIEDRR